MIRLREKQELKIHRRGIFRRFTEALPGGKEDTVKARKASLEWMPHL
ncbi:hypothetical protein [Alteribacillus persepolensis]|nr:hypothetical protein [Alteribacillus persepolensis]